MVSLSGHNILVLDRSQSDLKRIVQGFKSLDANVFEASQLKSGHVLQKRWDIDIIICDVSFLTEMGDVVAASGREGTTKSSPLLFAYGAGTLVHPKLLDAKGVLKFFAGSINPVDAAPMISGYLYDAKKHLAQLAESSIPREISFILQDGASTFPLEVIELSDEGLGVAALELIVSETASLTVVVPDKGGQRFSVRLERKTPGDDTIKIKLLWRDRERWAALLKVVDGKQKQILDFLTASSGK